MSQIRPLIAVQAPVRTAQRPAGVSALNHVAHTVMRPDGSCEEVTIDGSAQQRSVVSRPDPERQPGGMSIFELSARQAEAAAHAAHAAQADATAPSGVATATPNAATLIAKHDDDGEAVDEGDALAAVAATDETAAASVKEADPKEALAPSAASKLHELCEALVSRIQDANESSQQGTSVEFVPALPLFENTSFELRGEADRLRLNCNSNSAAERTWLETHGEALGSRLSASLGLKVTVAVAAAH